MDGMPTGVRQRPGWPGAAVLLLTLAWLAALVLVAYLYIGVGLESWAASYNDADEAAAADRVQRSYTLAMYFCLTLFVGPVLTAVVAAVGGLRRTAIGYGVVAVPLAGLALAGCALTVRDADPGPQAPPPPPGHCVPLSGSDNRCPGG
ncbi:DUF6234 family protein [Polymorphospora sp. NPDC051019]|uniref:DUF6234 family protein n=1 Tax=Polymorphospora sp. NPDC051019 TaxID=3155725 RepID=UPI00341218AD